MPRRNIAGPDLDRIRERERERQRAKRALETPEERAARNLRDRQRRAARRAAEGPYTRQDRRSQRAQTRSVERAQESDQARSNRIVAQVARNSRPARSRDLKLAAFNYNPATDYASHPSISIGSLDSICPFCNARTFKGETPGMCCAKGKIYLPLPQPPPEPILSLFSSDYPESREFIKNIRRYNSSFQMTSFGSTGQRKWPGWMPTYKVQGQIYHRIGSLLPMPDQQAKFIQIYFMGDSSIQIDARTRLFKEVKRPIIQLFQGLLDQENDLIKSFRTTLDRLPSDESRIVIRADRRPQGTHERTYNAPTTEEVAVVLVDDELSRRDIILQRRDSRLQRIDESHPFYDAFQYPLIFWKGQASWHFNLMQVNPITKVPTATRASPTKFYSHQLMIRSNNSQQPDFLLMCGPLLNQFAVDMYAKIEAQRLLYCRTNQKKLRAEKYIHLKDAIRNEKDINDVGKHVVLPSSFIGGPRHMHEYTQDALTYVRKHGRPDLFITFTCNASWHEITRELKPGQPYSDRHDIVARVFKQKVTKFMDVLTKYHLFGPTRCHMNSIEWQKRGLPHTHILIWLEERIRPEQMDDIISAELPDPALDPILYDIVTSTMIHGPCGHHNPDSPCMDEVKGTCTKRYPKLLNKETQTGEDGYPQYRRRSPTDGGQSYLKKLKNGQEVTIDNRWVVPHNRTLSRLFNAHINVEYCHSVKSIKYICKYINKGSDMAVVELEGPETIDEIEQFQLGRYISSNEAFWRIFGFAIHDRYPAVEHLAVHLENGQRVYFTNENAAAVAENPPESTLMAFFRLCQTDEFARGLLYADVSTYYRFEKPNFTRRKQGKPVPGVDIKKCDTIGRLYTVHPSQDECFYLRMLLTKVEGPRSFEDLRLFEGTLYPTYRAACQARGLLADDKHWDGALEEAAASRMPSHIRNLFAIIISNCYPSDPVALWEKFKDAMTEDILNTHRRLNPTIEVNFNPTFYNQSLILIENLTLMMCGKNLIELSMTSPNRSAADCINSDIVRETSYDLTSMGRVIEEGQSNMVADQRLAYDGIIQAIIEEKGGLYFLDAPGGTGKTFLLNLILARIRLDSKIILAAASSGIAATLLTGGRTAHSCFKLPIDLITKEQPVCEISRGTSRARLLQECKAIIWDECTMSHKKALEALDRTLRDIRGNSSIFGGMVVVLAGDFRQTLPVIPRSTPADELNACLKQSPLWEHVQKFKLSTNMRVHLQGDVEAGAFAAKLLTIGDGVHPLSPSGKIQLTSELCQQVKDIDELITKVFPDLQANISNHNWLRERAILGPTNEIVDKMNASIQDKLQGRAVRTYLSIDATCDPEQAVHYPSDFLNSLTISGMPPHKLTVKVGSPVMVLRNLCPPKLCNGTRLCVKRLHPNMIEATILAGPYKGEDVFIPRIPFIPNECIVQFKRIQFPIKLAYGFTVNKSQGQSLKVVGVELSQSCFSHGQLYVACSRVGSPSNLYVHAPGGETKNVVYQQALK